MGFPENILTKDEKVVKSLHPHWLTIFKPVLLGLLIAAVAGVVVWLTPVDPTWDIVDWVIIGIAVLALIWVLVVPILKWRTTHYVITNKRVAVRRGILSKSGQDIALSKITDVSFRQSLLDRITRSGSLNIETAGDSEDEDFSSIPRSNEVQQLLNHLIEEDAATKGGYGYAAHRGHEIMSHRSHDSSPTPDDPQQPPRFEQQTGGRRGQNVPSSSGGGWDTGSHESGNGGAGSQNSDGWGTGQHESSRGPGTGGHGAGRGRRDDSRDNQPPGPDGHAGDPWETPPTR